MKDAGKRLFCKAVHNPGPQVIEWEGDGVRTIENAFTAHGPGEDFIGEKARDILPCEACVFVDEGEGEKDVERN